MNQYISIKCPHCGASLKVKQQQGLEKASLTCPVCNVKSPFANYIIVSANNNSNSEDTELPNGFKQNNNQKEPLTELPSYLNKNIGCLVEKSGKRWTLHTGINTIGRKLQSDPQHVEIPIADYTGERKMSRNHAKIEVIRQPDGSCKHVFFNWQNKNQTYVSGELVESDDRIVLHDGMTIQLANVIVKFVIEDSDSTTI